MITLKTDLSTRLFSISLLLIAMISIQSGAALAKHFFPLVGAEGATALRLFFAATIMVIVMRPWRAQHTFLSLRWVVLYGLALGGMNLLFYLSIRTVPLGIGVALEFMGPLAIAIYSSRRIVDFFWILLVVIGLYLLLPIGSELNSIDPMGALYGLGAGACWAFYIFFGKRAGTHYGTQGVAIGMVVAAFLVVPFGVAKAGLALFSVDLIPLAIALAILSSALPYSLEMVALTRLPARTFGILMSIEPVCATFSGLLFLDEKLTWIQWLAIMAIVIASAGTTVNIQSKNDKKSP